MSKIETMSQFFKTNAQKSKGKKTFNMDMSQSLGKSLHELDESSGDEFDNN